MGFIGKRLLMKIVKGLGVVMYFHVKPIEYLFSFKLTVIIVVHIYLSYPELVVQCLATHVYIVSDCLYTSEVSA